MEEIFYPLRKYLVLGIFVVCLITMSFGLPLVGEHWDEVTVASVGESYLGFIKNGDFSSKSWELNHEHPPVAKYIYGSARFLTKNISLLQDGRGFFPEGRDFSFARFISVLMSSITVAVTFLIGSKIFKSWKISLISSLFILLNPVFQSYARIVSLEVPLLLFGSIFVLFCLNYGEKNSLLNYVLAVMAFTLLIGTRYNGVLLLPFFYLAQTDDFKSIKRLINLKNIIFPFLSLVFLFIIWPYLWHNPINAFLSSADRGLEVHTREYFLGILGNTPWYYYLSYFLVKTPLVLLAIFVIGICGSLGVLGRLKNNKTKIILLFLLPFVASFLPLKQDGLRYVNLYLIGFSQILTVGLFQALGFLKGRQIKLAFLSTVFGLLGFTIYRSFPYFLDYYNSIVQPQQIYKERLYEIGGWGEGTFETIYKLNLIFKDGKKKLVYLSIFPEHIIPNLPEGFVRTVDISKADIILRSTNSKWYDDDISKEDLEQYKLIYQVVVNNNLPLVEIYEKRT